MAWIKCKYCNKRISDKAKKCPRCNKKLIEENTNISLFLCNSIFIVLPVILCFILCLCGSTFFYTDSFLDLFIVFIICLIIYIDVFFCSRSILKKKKYNWIWIAAGLIMFFSFVISTIYLVKGIEAFKYNNSVEVFNLSKSFKISKSKDIKEKLDGYFEYDFDKGFSRDIIISSFYCSDDVCTLYVDDIYGNYTLKFFVIMKNDTILDIYWCINDVKFYLVKNGKKTDDFEYYYAMNIISSVSGEDISNLLTIEDVVEQKVRGSLGDISALMLTYEQLNYSSDKNMFYRNCEVESMDFYGNIDNTKFIVFFEKDDDNNKRGNWYYGDSSFDYVNFNVNV